MDIKLYNTSPLPYCCSTWGRLMWLLFIYFFHFCLLPLLFYVYVYTLWTDLLWQRHFLQDELLWWSIFYLILYFTYTFTQSLKQSQRYIHDNDMTVITYLKQVSPLLHCGLDGHTAINILKPLFRLGVQDFHQGRSRCGGGRGDGILQFVGLDAGGDGCSGWGTTPNLLAQFKVEEHHSSVATPVSSVCISLLLP